KILQRGSYSPIAAQGRACPVCPPPMQPDVKLDDTAVDGVLGYTQGSPWGRFHSWPRNGASFAPRESAPQCRDQPVEFDRFGVKLVAPCSEGLFSLAGQCMCGESDESAPQS